jgi:hypothetical protein
MAKLKRQVGGSEAADAPNCSRDHENAAAPDRGGMMLARDLKELPVGSRLLWVVGTGVNEVRHPAKLLKCTGDQVEILVNWLDEPPMKRRWSLRTNRPVGTKGRRGSVRLELAR